MELEEDPSDLDIAHVVGKEFQVIDEYINHINSVSETEDEDDIVVQEESPIDVLDSSSDTITSSGDDDNTKVNNLSKKRKTHDTGEKVGWSSEEDPEEVYLNFKNRKSKKRKLAAAETKKIKARASSKPSNVARGKQSVNSTAVVGRRTRPGTQSRYKLKIKEETDADLQDQLDDEHLPDYLQKRKEKFEKVKERLGNAGLKLPPDYEDIYFSDDERMDQLQEKPDFRGTKPAGPYQDVTLEYSGGVVPAAIAQWIRDYQFQGIEFLHELFVWQRGGLLGDDMGLGKTIQVISFLTAAFGKTGDERDAKRMRKMRRLGTDRWYPRVLIVCPGTLIKNWESELDRWGWWEVYVYHGTAAEKENALLAAAHGRLEIMITTYNTYRMNKSAVNTVNWDCVVADECHIIKGRAAEVTQAMGDINALCRIGLTGTAIQNNYDELWTLLNWTNPGRFASLASWRDSISKPLKIGQAHDATSLQLGLARRTANKLVKNLLPNFFLRRMKSLIAHQLPKKTDRVIFCPLTAKQAEAYNNYIECDVVEYIRTSTEICDCDSGKKRGWCCYGEIPGHGKWQNFVFPAIQNLQKLCNHMALLIPSGKDSIEKQSKDLETLQFAFPDSYKDLYRQRDSIFNYSNQDFCGKWKILKKLLQFWHANGDKVLVFSLSVRLLRMLHVLFEATAYNVSYLDGNMSLDDRARAVDDFNSNSQQFVFLISTKAGGVGLNITSANKVVVFDPNWNPAYDLQAQDRAYRIGQLRDVEVFRLISAGTIEEVIYARQIYKQQQANIGYTASSERRYFSGVQDEKDKKGEIFGLANLFNYRGGGQILLKDIVNKTNVAESKMGVLISDVDLSQIEEDEDFPLRGDDENAAMTQLAAIITSGEDGLVKKVKAAPKKTDPVQAILASAGVEYTHENSEVIGTSKTEAKLSRKAAENLDTIDGVDEPIFTDTKADVLDGVEYKFQPPEEVRMRQFCTMAKMFDFEDVTEFALVVEGWSQEQRRDCLDQFYRMRREKMMVEGHVRGKGDEEMAREDNGEKEPAVKDEDGSDDEL